MTMTPQAGDYGVVDLHPGGFPRIVAGIIRLVTRSPWCHAFVVIDGGDVVEATPNGAVRRHLSEYDGATVAYSDLEPKTDIQRAAIVAAAVKTIGTGYGFADIAALGLAALGVRWGWLLDRVARSDRLICSQLVDVSYKAAGLDLVPGRPAQAVTPADLGIRLATRPWET